MEEPCFQSSENKTKIQKERENYTMKNINDLTIKKSDKNKADTFIESKKFETLSTNYQQSLENQDQNKEEQKSQIIEDNQCNNLKFNEQQDAKRNQITSKSQASDCQFEQFNPYDYENQAKIVVGELNEENIPITSKPREWSIKLFDEKNSNKTLSQNFIEQKNIILDVLEKQNCYLMEFLKSQNKQDLFQGFYKNHQPEYFILINQTENQQEIKIIKQLEQLKLTKLIKEIKVTENIHTLILQKENYNIVEQQIKQLIQKEIKIWDKQYFIQINEGKDINLIRCYKCQNCQNSMECSDYQHFRQFQLVQDVIFEALQRKYYYLCQYLAKGGEGIIFEGFKIKQVGVYEDFIFKIIFDLNDQEIQSEISIMKLFEKNINVIKFIEVIQVSKNIHIFVLEKCKYSLKDELFLIEQQKEEFNQMKLLRIIFDLLDGLIQFRIYNILHLDIKPQNILVSKSDNYVFTDFGISSIKKDNSKINIKGGTFSYASPEQLIDDPNIDFKSDVYSLGKTFEVVLKQYKKQEDEFLVLKFNQIVQQKMIQNQKDQRKSCLELHEEFLKLLIECNCQEFLQEYLQKIKYILKLFPYDDNKNITYFLDLMLYYNQKTYEIYQYFLQIEENEIALKQILKKMVKAQEDISECFSDLGDSKKALKCQLECLLQKKTFFKNDLSSIAKSFNNLGQRYLEFKQFQQALKYQLKSLKLTQQLFKGNHINVAVSLSNVGVCYRELNDQQKALQYFLQSYQMSKHVYKGNNSSIATVLNNIGACYYSLYDYRNALDYYEKSLFMRRQIYKGSHPEIAQSLNNIGMYYKDISCFELALQYLNESLEMIRVIHKEDHPLVASTLNNIGLCYLNIADYDIALNHLLKSLEIKKRIYSENHQEIAQSLHNIGSCYTQNGQNDKALEYFKESLKIKRLIYPENHIQIALSLDGIASYYSDTDDNQQALGYYLESLQIRKINFQNANPHVSASLNNVGFCYLGLKECEKALKYLEESLEMDKKLYQGDNESVATSLNNIGSCYLKMGDKNQALKNLMSSLQMRKRIYKKDHPSIATSLDRVGVCYQDLQDQKNAEKYLLESLKMREKIFKKNHPDIVISLDNLGEFYRSIQNYKTSLTFFLKSLKINQSIYEKDHLEIANSIKEVIQCYSDLQDQEKVKEYQQKYDHIIKQIDLKKQESKN
ncbi:tetratricopeptide repeat protein (macronuclear) [Tetrahymena thermophila SB210]|uniref:Tetratricopeptide repeat protein n=1 Tax=Tetrahymena thermophila (strain SB210) TaxID=312017 RepID=W7X808_TETTS|nr:tetratricopeptide repeat protein [Tetrahymena thermophila SB210]EWS75510.1 tetratricopeptide repeat protein [Tetrahymena thermophila SB210]|eukprot:XP_012651979.1 tetratricopeptide repeat protein [Tetrahymena thermophila SB210]